MSPSEVVAQLTEKNGNLCNTVEEQAAELYWSMKNSLAHRGKDFVDVGKKQQQRHLEQIQQVNVYYNSDQTNSLLTVNKSCL